MDVPYSTEHFLELFRNYNTSVFPLQIFFFIFALFLIFLSFKKRKNSDKIINYGLAFFWLWIGFVYELFYFSTIGPSAHFYAVLFLLQSILFVVIGGVREEISYKFTPTLYGIIGFIFIIYGLILYPFIGAIVGHVYPEVATIGQPAPTLIFTVGFLLMTDKKVPFYMLILPLYYSIMDMLDVLHFGIYEDIAVVFTGIAGFLIVLFANRYRETIP